MTLRYEKDQADPTAEAAQAFGQDAEHADPSTHRRYKVGQGPLAFRLQTPRLGVGVRTLEQIEPFH